MNSRFMLLVGIISDVILLGFIAIVVTNDSDTLWA